MSVLEVVTVASSLRYPALEAALTPIIEHDTVGSRALFNLLTENRIPNQYIKNLYAKLVRGLCAIMCLRCVVPCPVVSEVSSGFILDVTRCMCTPCLHVCVLSVVRFGGLAVSGGWVQDTPVPNRTAVASTVKHDPIDTTVSTTARKNASPLAASAAAAAAPTSPLKAAAAAAPTATATTAVAPSPKRFSPTTFPPALRAGVSLIVLDFDLTVLNIHSYGQRIAAADVPRSVFLAVT